jgi:hypothetical protein
MTDDIQPRPPDPKPVDEVEAAQPLPEPRPSAPPELTEPEPATTDPTPPAAAKDRRFVALLAATAVLLITTILFGLMAFFPRIAPIKSGPARLAASAQEEEEIKTVARRFAKNFLTVDYRTIDNDFKQVTSDATGKFKQQLGQVLKLSREQFAKRKATSKGEVSEVFVLTHEDDTAVVRVVVNRTISNARTKGPESGQQILDVTLVSTPDGWKVDDLRQLGAQPQN